METPIADFVRRYSAAAPIRLHMPGHKGKPFLGCEPLDITEIPGADELYDASGIIAESERNAAALFGSVRTLFSTEGSSQCIRAMVYLAVTCRRPDAAPVIVAARNAHKSLLYAAALTGAEIVWLWPETQRSICGCPVSPESLRKTLGCLPVRPAAVYLTSPDYLGGMAEIAGIRRVCRASGVPLLVDNAHGAYLRFLHPSLHPLDLGADLCCDSAHKTLPVLTGGAYLHIGAGSETVSLTDSFRERARDAMALFGSTSPSYLTLASLDLCNRYLSEGYPRRLRETVEQLERLRSLLRSRSWQVEESDPLRITLRGDTEVMRKRLRKGGIRWEYADRDFLVFMATPENDPADFDRAAEALGKNDRGVPPPPALPLWRGERVLTPREALFAPSRRIPADQSLGRICAAPTVGCPPAIPIAVSGERIDPEAVALFRRYGVREVDVVETGFTAPSASVSAREHA